MEVSFIVEGGSGPGNRRSGSLPRVPRETWEGLNVAPAPSLRVLQGSGGEQVEACEKQRQFDENQQKYG